MKRLRAVASLLIWATLGVSAAVALGSALVSLHPVNPEKASAGWAEVPSWPGPLLLDAGRDDQLIRVSFDSHTPAMRSGVLLNWWTALRKACGREEEHRISLLDFGPLYRRPPPSLS